MSNDHTDALGRLRDAIRRTVTKDTTVQEFMTMVELPIEPDAPMEAHIFLIVDEDAPPVVADNETKDEFDSIMEGAAQAEREEKARESAAGLEQLRDNLKDNPKGGIL